MPPPLPRCSSGAYSSLILPRHISLPRKGRRVGLHIVLFEACSAFTRVAACTLARSPIRDPLSEGFRHFVSSMTAPIASGWSEIAGWDLHPLESAALSQPNVLFNIAQHQYVTSQYPNFGQYSPRRASRRRHRGCKRRRGRSGAPIKKARPLDRPPLQTMVPLAQQYDVPINRTGPEL